MDTANLMQCANHIYVTLQPLRGIDVKKVQYQALEDAILFRVEYVQGGKMKSVVASVPDDDAGENEVYDALDKQLIKSIFAI